MHEQKKEEPECHDCESREPELDAEDEGILDLYSGIKNWGFHKVLFDMFDFPMDPLTVHKLNIIKDIVDKRREEPEE